MDLFEAIFLEANLGIVVSNLEGLIERVNPFAEKLFGYQESELLGKPIECLLPMALRDKHVAQRESFRQRPSHRPMGLGLDLSAQKKDGTLFPVEISLAPYERLGKKEVVSFIGDISERKRIDDNIKSLNAKLEKKVEERTEELSQTLRELQHKNLSLEEEMEHRKKAEWRCQEALGRERELNELKSRFVSIASHEFRTPLSAILSSASLLSKYQEPTDRENRERHIHIIKSAVKSLNELLQDFLSMNRLEEGAIQQHPSRFSLSQLAFELVEEMRTLAKPGQKIEYLKGEGEDVVYLDKILLRSILLNLLSNAVKYSREGGVVKLNTEVGQSKISISVEDHGIGVPEVELKHLFEMFYRASNTANIQGTGLGLNIVKRYLDLMGGVIQLSSKLNEGSRFTVILPKIPEPSI